ncbi:Poly(3-hydroxybutyrate) depolymerase [Leptospira biflexa serovar Patoc strain 'Patoc 1 (Ames)']|uniref:Putative feruloyl esterase n=1 Tax=Leptospira biflexa serovar Patoc (strain Patoc 1 / ATCC 23582 / Paris) TaxID=456481 RepID=B0SRY0_LEPBP|nr:prolyl oligopeptidase family serine peptidase [Leptospira biflexa]ABZ95803.1 Poly(3-hydroxybutyrate) depolymerase [Leptospira biflexa serovar Patoc strain 'Patoc 1 (Ames)']ABZ99515.1 Putative feruloyl esterase [Leptospira biflexa serovar Patoc strain 'Patoc 1 (Paris)']
MIRNRYEIFRLHLILILMIPFSFFCKSLPSVVPVKDHTLESIVSDGIVRTFRYYIPKNRSETKLPVVFILHGGGGSGEGMIYLSRMSEKAEEYGFIAVYPDGYANRWNDGRKIAHSLTDKRNTKDVEFFRDMVRFIDLKIPVDYSRIHAVGISNGGFMTQRLLCEADDLFRSVYSVAAVTSKGLVEICPSPRAKSIGFIMGTADDVIPYSGGTVSIPKDMSPNASRIPAGEVLSFTDSLKFWSSNFTCKEESKAKKRHLNKFWKRDIEYTKFSDCSTDEVVEGYLIPGGGHIWPNGFFYQNEKQYGYLSKDLDTREIVIQFFRRTDSKEKLVDNASFGN